MEQEVAFTTPNNIALTGVQAFENASTPVDKDPNVVHPNAIRWLFNPYAVVDVSDRPVTGYLRLQPGVFIPITSQNERISLSGISSGTGMTARSSDFGDGVVNDNGVVTGGRSGENRYRNHTRTAYAIATEIEAAYADKGVRILPSLTQFEDRMVVETIFHTLVAPGLSYGVDPYQPNLPVPNLIILETYLAQTAIRHAAEIVSDTEGVNPVAVVSDLLVGIRTAIATCRAVTREAKRVIANRTIGHAHSFDAYQARAFVALGEMVPSDLGEMYGKTSATMPVSDQSEIARLRAENEQLRRDAVERENEELKAELARLTAVSDQPPVEDAPVETEPVVTCSHYKDSGEQCKTRTGLDADGRCRFHPLETTNKETEDVNTETK